MINFKFIASVILGIFVFSDNSNGTIGYLYISAIVNNTGRTGETNCKILGHNQRLTNIRSSAKKQH